MARLISTRAEIDRYVSILKYMWKKDKYIPAFFQVALIQGLSSAPPGVVLYFFEEASKISTEFVVDYFGSPLNFVDDDVQIETNRIKDLEKLL